MKCLSEKELDDLIHSTSKIKGVLKRQHLKNCPECHERYLEMQENLKLEDTILQRFHPPGK